MRVHNLALGLFLIVVGLVVVVLSIVARSRDFRFANLVRPERRGFRLDVGEQGLQDAGRALYFGFLCFGLLFIPWAWPRC
jgi:hypothetical protein